MAQFHSLRDFYSFPGFTPIATVRGVFGDSYAALVTLRRRPQKRSAANADFPIAPSTINPFAGSATSIAVVGASTSNSLCGGSIAASATP
jgi:hypothetical protein